MTQKQNELLSYLKSFKRKFYLVGGTAIALHLGHRRSIDFDLFCLTLSSLLSLASMKAYALGRRAKWKDYVDLYFILKEHLTINEISMEAVKNFGEFYSEKLFREQLSFHKDIDYSEPVEYMVDPPAEDEIKSFLFTERLTLNISRVILFSILVIMVWMEI